jgi:hypothetical protein
MVLLRHQAGAQYSQSPIEADGGAVIDLYVATQCKLLINTDHIQKERRQIGA